jgi:hypothetical protein
MKTKKNNFRLGRFPHGVKRFWGKMIPSWNHSIAVFGFWFFFVEKQPVFRSVDAEIERLRPKIAQRLKERQSLKKLQ